MTTGLSYDGTIAGTTSYVQQVAQLLVVDPTDTNFLAILPQMIVYAENRIYRDLDFLSTVAPNTYTLGAGLHSFTVPWADFITVQQINVLTPATVTIADSGLRNPLLPVSKEFLNVVYPDSSTAGVPYYFAPSSNGFSFIYLLGPWPDKAYTVEVIGTIRPASMSATSGTKTTFISLYLPDLFIMASLVYGSAYQRNWSGPSPNDPQMPVTYESQYQALLKSAGIEEARKKFQSSGWASMSPAPVATPSRG
jgi:hypothetical protein